MPEPTSHGASVADRPEAGFTVLRAVPPSIWLSAGFLVLIAGAGILASSLAPFGIDNADVRRFHRQVYSGIVLHSCFLPSGPTTRRCAAQPARGSSHKLHDDS